MGIFRSEEMKHGTLVLPSDRAREYLDTLGREVNIQFVDMNEKTMKRQYKKYIQRIDDMERILRFLEENINKLPNVKIKKSKIENFLDHDNIYELDQVEESLNRLYVQFVRFCKNNKELVDEKNNAIEEKHVILAAINQLQPEFSKSLSGSIKIPEKSVGYDDKNEENNSLSAHIMKDSISMMFTNISGVIKTKDQESFGRTIFRALRGNAYTYFQNIDEDFEDSQYDSDDKAAANGVPGISAPGETDGSSGKESKKELKSVFVVYCQGSTQSNIYEKIMKICKAYDVKTYDWPKTYEFAVNRLKELREVINDKDKALKAYEDYFINEIFVLINVVEPNKNSLIEEWKLFCKKERHIYNSLNYFEGSDITLRCDCWFSTSDEEKIRDVLITKYSNDLVSALLLTDKMLTPNVCPPTYIKTNTFTQPYQTIIDTYGVPRYGEINPAIYTTITFPFLFGIMYGDVGHGLCVFGLALFLIIINRKLKNKKNNEILAMLLEGRYMLLLMGFFAMYSGFLYNDFFAIPLNIFSSMFEQNTKIDDVAYYKRKIITTSDGAQEFRHPYIFGFDSSWLGATNELTYINSFKMKFSIIIGFIHMMSGTIIKGFNSIHFRRKMDFFFEFVPQLIMMITIVGYLVFLIIYKWVTPEGYMGFKKQGIINTVINMYLMKSIGADDQFYPYQPVVQGIILVLLAICVPVMLFCKPVIITVQRTTARKKNAHKYYQNAEKEMTNAINHDYVDKEDVENNSNAPNASNSAIHKRSTKLTSNTTSKTYLPKERKANEHEMEAHLLSSPSEHFDDPHAEEELGAIWIEQLIETIEFILGLISNTASYLRLWALSLAHQQLSTVFFEQTILTALRRETFIGVLISLLIWIQLFTVLTLAVIVFMDSLECFLHSLRLQWVEFQNKFYKGDGIPFKPFNIKTILSENE